MKSNEASGLLSQALKNNNYPTSYLTELTNFLKINLGSGELLTTQQHSLLQHLLYSLVQQVPVEYLVGEALFYNRRFNVSRDVLIPRFDTEKLVTEGLAIMKAHEEPTTIIDIGTGSGAIIITLALELQKRKNIKYIAIDLSPSALEIAKENARRFNIDSLITFQIANSIPYNEHKTALIPDSDFILIVSNPPYIAPKHYEALPKSVKDFEPELALIEQPEFLTKLTGYIHLLSKYRKSVSIAIEYNDKSGTARWHTFANPTKHDLLDLGQL